MCLYQSRFFRTVTTSTHPEGNLLCRFFPDAKLLYLVLNYHVSADESDPLNFKNHQPFYFLNPGVAPRDSESGGVRFISKSVVRLDDLRTTSD